MSTRKQDDPPSRVRAVRGATVVPADDPGAIVAATAELLRAMLARNDLAVDDLVSVIFTSTEDLTAEFPASAARTLGIADIPLLCAREIPVPGALARCVRVLLHCYTAKERGALRHVYVGEAQRLRDDLPQ
ncbi:MAG: chorismate mutase [Actinomycetota bacterium]